MEKCLVTIVVPIYGVENYLNRCVESVVNQTYTNLEILLIDDGSPDQCPQMCDEWAQRDGRIRVIHKRNEGIGMARNTGIENARGDYICFFDGDDYIALDTIEKLQRVLSDSQAELVLFGFKSMSNDNRCITEHIPCTQKTLYRDAEIKENLIPNMISDVAGMNLSLSACMALFSMKLIHKTNWRFASEREIISEDAYSMLELCNAVRSVAIIPEALYYYCENVASASRVYREDRYLKIKTFYDETQKLCRRLQYGAVIEARVHRLFLAYTIAALKQTAAVQLPLRKRIQLTLEILKDPMLQEAVSTLDISKENLPRKLLFTAIRKKCYYLAFCYIWLKAHS